MTICEVFDKQKYFHVHYAYLRLDTIQDKQNDEPISDHILDLNLVPALIMFIHSSHENNDFPLFLALSYHTTHAHTHSH